MKKTLLLVLILVSGRIWLTTNTKHGDLHNGWNWAQNVTRLGVVGFYDLPKEVFFPQSRPNQPAGSVYLYTWSYWFNTAADSTFKSVNEKVSLFPSQIVWWWERWGDVVSLKLPSVVGDLAIYAAILYWGKKMKKLKLANMVGIVYLLNPALWYNSSLWGQNDCIVAALAIWSIILLFEKKLVWSGVLLGISLATKASWAPLGLLYLIYAWKKYSFQAIKMVAVPVAVLALFWPFHPQVDLPIWLTRLYMQRILPGESPFVSVNAFNFWQLIYGYDQIVDSLHHANLVGMAIVALLAIKTGYQLWRKATEEQLLYLMLVLYFGIFLFATRMHERYLYPLFPLMSLLLVGGYKIWKQYTVLSVTYLINLYSQWWAPTVPALVSIFTPNFTRLVSIVNLITFGSILKTKRHA